MVFQKCSTVFWWFEKNKCEEWVLTCSFSSKVKKIAGTMPINT